jgi:hypothetical protein
LCRLLYFTQQQAPAGQQGQASQTQAPVSQQPQAHEQAQGAPLSQQPALHAGAAAGVENREASMSKKAFIEKSPVKNGKLKSKKWRFGKGPRVIAEPVCH